MYMCIYNYNFSIIIVCVCTREIFHGKRWHTAPQFAAPMVEYEGNAYYVNDFVRFNHSVFGPTTGKILKFYAKVGMHGDVHILLD